MPAPFSLRPALPHDSAWIAELRAVVMRPDLVRLGRFDPVRVRQRFLDAYRPEHARIIEVDGKDAGVIAVRPEDDGLWIEHFFIDPGYQGRGIGGGVLRQVMRDSADGRPFRLDVLQGSAARRLYERHGFVLESEDPVDVFMVAGAAWS